MLKRILALLLCLLFCGMFVVVPVSAEGDPVVSAVHVYGKPGEVVNIPLKLTDNPGFYIMYVKMRYDVNVFSIEGVDNGDYTGIIQELSDQPGRNMCNIGIECTSSMDVNGDGVLCIMRVKIKDNAQPGRYGLNLYMDKGGACDYGGHYVDPQFLSGSITVVCADHTGVSGTCPTCGAVVGDDAAVTSVPDAPVNAAPNSEESAYVTTPITPSESSKHDEQRAENADRLAKEKAEETKKQEQILRQHKLNQFFGLGGLIPPLVGKIILGVLAVGLMTGVVLLVLHSVKKLKNKTE